MKPFPGRLNWRSATIRTSTGSTRSTAVPPESLGRWPWPKLRQAFGRYIEHCAELQLLHWYRRTTRSRLSAGRPGRQSPYGSPAQLPASQRRRRLRRNKSPGITVGPRSGLPERRPKSSKLMGGATAQGRAIQPGGSEPPIPGLCRMGRRPNRFGLPSRSGSELKRTTPSGKVSLLASTDTYIRLANLSFGHSGRAH